jgi:Protein of unknown function (DUF2817)
MTPSSADDPQIDAATRRCFHHDYAAAKTRFLAAASAAGARLASFTCPAPGPNGESLTLDAAHVGRVDAERLLVVISGIHGVEGYGGAAIQLDALETLPALGDVALLLIHVVNPWGMAASSSDNENTIDLNRNFIDFSQPPSRNAFYDEVDEFVCCPEYAGPLRETADAHIAAYIESHGLERLARAVADGQYHRPGRYNFGGREPTWSNRTLRAVIANFAQSARHMGVIDVHTGLGDRGEGVMLCIEPPDATALERARSWWPNTLAVPSAQFPFAPRGTFVSAAWHLDVAPMITAAALEIGTEPPERVFAAMRNRFWLATVGAAPGTVAAAICAEMHACFAPRDAAWRRAALLSGRRAIRAAIRGLTAE